MSNTDPSSTSSADQLLEPKKSRASWWQKLATHLSYWLFNGGLIFWLFAALLSNNALVATILQLVPQMLLRFEPAGFIGVASLGLLIFTPVLGVLSYVFLLFSSEGSLKKIWLLQLQQLLILLFAGLTFFATQIGLNMGALLILFILQFLPLQSIFNLVGHAIPNTKQELGRVRIVISLVLNTLVLTVVGYLAVLLLFIIPVTLYGIVMSLTLFASSFDLFSLLMFMFFLIGAVVLIGIFTLPYVYSKKAYVSVAKWYALAIPRFGRPLTLAITVGAGALLVGVVVIAAQPIPQKYTQKIDDYANASSFETKQELARELKPAERQIERELLSISNDRVRYLINPRYQRMADFYSGAFHAPDQIANGIETVFHVVAHPFVEPISATLSSSDYQRRSSRRQAFESLFGYEPGESESEFSQLIENSDSVSLVERAITGQTYLEGRLAEITVTEEYVNSDRWEQEISYVFSLPPSAVITDLKLGPNLEFQGQIAPRGAAEQVFNEQVRANRDPALLEMVGPSQYRLRVFPIPPKNDENQTGNQKVSYSYVTLLEPNGYALPVYGTVQNLETDLTRRIGPELDGQKVSSNGEKTHIVSLVNYCGATSDAQVVRSTISTQICGSGAQLMNSLLPKNQVITLIVDVSARKHDTVTRNAIRDFLEKSQQFLTENRVEVVMVNDAGTQKQQLTPQNWQRWLDDLVFFGQHDTAAVLSAIPEGGDLVLVVGNSQETVALPVGAAENKLPLTHFYWVYLEGSPPPMSQNVVQQVSKQRALAVTSFEDALLHRQSQRVAIPSGVALSPYWQYAQSTWAVADPGAGYQQVETQVAPLRKMITAKLIQEWVSRFDFDQAIAASTSRRSDAPPIFFDSDATALGRELRPEDIETTLSDQLNLLDYLHQIAQDQGIVTAYSSYIALVNLEQQNRLDQLSQQTDRFASDSSVRSGAMPAPMLPTSMLPTSSRSVGFTSASPLDSLGVSFLDGETQESLPSGAKLLLVSMFASVLLATGVGAWWWRRRQSRSAQPND